MGNIESVPQERECFRRARSLSDRPTCPGWTRIRRCATEAEQNFSGFWARFARENLEWSKPFTQVLDESKAPFYKWFADGELNASYNCLDRNLKNGNADKVAIIFEADDGKVTKITYRELHGRFAARQRDERARPRDRRSRDHLYADVDRRGGRNAGVRAARHHALGGVRRLLGQECAGTSHRCRRDLIIAADGQMRGGKAIALKPAIDDAFAMGGCDKVRNVIVYKRTGGKVAMQSPRDKWLHDVVKAARAPAIRRRSTQSIRCSFCTRRARPASPKGVQHSTGGYLLWCRAHDEVGVRHQAVGRLLVHG